MTALRIALRLGLGLLLAASLMALSLPLVAALPLAVLAVVLLWRRRELPNLATLALALAVVVGGIEIVLRLTAAAPTYYRPHEMLQGEGIAYYRANQSVADYPVPHGDIGALWPDMPRDVRSPRTVRFATDGLGFRNDADYAGAPFVAVGDSFVVGNGTDQDDTLTSVLARAHGVDSYNAGFPSGPQAYGRMFRDAVEDRGGAARAIVLVFEGNDLMCPEDLARFRPDRRWWNYVPGEIRRLEAYRLTYGLSRRAIARLMPGIAAPGFVRQVGGRPMAFFAPYAAAARAESGDGCDWPAAIAPVAEIADRIALLAFIPTKYRVYAPLIDGELDRALPDARRDFLAGFARARDIPFLDLTPALAQAARDGLDAGRDAYWRDDTHWAPAGIAAAARAIAEALRGNDAARR